MPDREFEFRYQLITPDETLREESVVARNKTEARELIGRAYREETPRQAKRSGFHPFSACRIEWTDVVDLSTDLQTAIAHAQAEEPTSAAEAITDPRVGMLMREGKPVFYAFLNEDYENGYVEGNVGAVSLALQNSQSPRSSENAADFGP